MRVGGKNVSQRPPLVLRSVRLPFMCALVIDRRERIVMLVGEIVILRHMMFDVNFMAGLCPPAFEACIFVRGQPTFLAKVAKHAREHVTLITRTLHVIFKIVATYAPRHGFMFFQTAIYAASLKRAEAAMHATAQNATRRTRAVMRNVHPYIIAAVHHFAKVVVAHAAVYVTLIIQILAASPTGGLV